MEFKRRFLLRLSTKSRFPYLQNRSAFVLAGDSLEICWFFLVIPASSFVVLPSFLSAFPTACSAPQAPAFFQIESYLPYLVENLHVDAGKNAGKDAGKAADGAANKAACKAAGKAAELEMVDPDNPVDKEPSV